MKKMKKIMLMMVGALLMAACATLTPEEKAARLEERMEVVKEAVKDQQYRINISSMRPLRGNKMDVFNQYIKVDGNKVICYVPYLGVDDIPHIKSFSELRHDSRLDFTSEITNYLFRLDVKEDKGIITFNAAHGLDKFKFTLALTKDGEAKVRIEPERRDYIDYEGKLDKLR